MTDKEMHKLSRRELLQLLLTQGRDTEKLRKSLEEIQGEYQKLTENYERLKKRLDHKDEQIHGLRETLQKERTNRRIELDEAGSIAEAALRLNGIFEAAQKTAEQYLYNIRLMYDNKVAELNAEAPVNPEKENPEYEFPVDSEESPEETVKAAGGNFAEEAAEEKESMGKKAEGENTEETEEEAGEKSGEYGERLEIISERISEERENTSQEAGETEEAQVSEETQASEEPVLEELFRESRELPQEQDGKKSRKKRWGLRKKQSK